MAVHNDIAFVVVGTGGPTVTFTSGTITVTAVDAQSVGMVGVPVPSPVEVLEVTTQGVQGAKGDQNVYPGTVAPANPQLNWIWIKI